MANPFLSDAWLDELQKLAADAGGGMMPGNVKLNLVVSGTPEGDKELHVADGTFAKGLADDSPTKLTVPYDIAKSMFIKGDQQAAMQAFMNGQIKVEGDMSQLMAMQGQAGGAPDDAAREMQAKIREMTSDLD